MNNDHQHIEIYLDYSTIPSLNYFLHFLKNFEDKKTIRLFGLSRFTIPQSIIEQFPDGIIQFVPVKPEAQDNFNQKFAELLLGQYKSISLTFHLNLVHGLDMLFPLINIYKLFLKKITDIRLNFYDDGAAGIVQQLRMIEQQELSSNIELNKKSLRSFINDDVDNSISFHRYMVSYLWNTIYPTTYHFISDKFLEFEELAILKREIKDYKLINFNDFHQLNDKQLANLLLILNISSKWIEMCKEIFSSRSIFVFMGTAFWGLTPKQENAFLKLHTDLINYYIRKLKKEMPDTLFAFKGHPHSLEINQKIREEHPEIIHLPPPIPLEILYILGVKPSMIGGFSSTSYLTLPDIHIDKVIFFTHKSEKLRNQHNIFLDHYEYLKAVLELGLISPKVVSYLDDKIEFGQ